MTQKRRTSSSSPHQAPRPGSGAAQNTSFIPRQPRQLITFDDKHPRSANGKFALKYPIKLR